MNIDDATHIPWARLPIEARFLFILFFSGVFGPEELDRNTVVCELAKIWDEEKLTLALLNDDDRFWFLYRKYGQRYSEGVWRLEVYGISRQEAERVGFITPRAKTSVAQLCRGGRPGERSRRSKR
jgi:hypothetical protein